MSKHTGRSGITFDASAEAGRVAKLPLAGRLLGRVGGQTADEERGAQTQVLVFAFVDHGPGVALVDAQREILLLRQQLDRVASTVRNRFVATNHTDRQTVST